MSMNHVDVANFVENNLTEVLDYLVENEKIRVIIEGYEASYDPQITEEEIALFASIPDEALIESIQDYETSQLDLLRYI